MKTTTDYVDAIVELAREVEMGDPIDWGMLEISEDNAYQLIAINVIKQMETKYNDPNFREIMLATVVKLIVENFVLNLQAAQREY